MYLERRELPQLVTARTTSTTSKTTAKAATTTSKAAKAAKTTKASGHKSLPSLASKKENDDNDATTTKHHTMPGLTTPSPSATLPSSPSYTSTSIVQATVMIPNQENTPYSYKSSSDINGTVYIAFGSVLGFLIFLILLIWSILSFKSWYVARKQAQYRNSFKQNYNKPIDDFITEPAFLDDSDTWSSQSSNDSDISEKVIKQQQQQQQHKASKSINTQDLQELFVSPTEVLFHSGGNHTNGANSPLSIPSVVPSGASSPMYIQNSSMAIPTITINNVSNSESTLNSSSNNSTDNANATKKFRPPSVHLDQLLNDLE